MTRAGEEGEATPPLQARHSSQCTLPFEVCALMSTWEPNSVVAKTSAIIISSAKNCRLERPDANFAMLVCRVTP